MGAADARVVLALLAWSLLDLVEVSPDSAFGQPLFQGTADDARALLIAIASTMATVIALVLGHGRDTAALSQPRDAAARGSGVRTRVRRRVLREVTG